MERLYSFTDLLHILIAIPYTATSYVERQWSFGDTWCGIVNYVTYASAFAKAYTLVLLWSDQWIGTSLSHFAAEFRADETRNMGICVGILLTVIALTNIPLFLTHGVLQIGTATACEEALLPCMFHHHLYNENAFRWAFLGTFFLLPLALMASLAVIVEWDNGENGKHFKRALYTMTAVFAVCWGPTTFILALQSMNVYPVRTTTVIIQVAAHVLATASVCVNPIILAALHPEYRSTLVSALCCRQPPSSSTLDRV
ncbi:allatostatin-A receptor-like [Paramacrobiotus metropolitanus]|uniref:allatostatin-A receptor-like n=1 Tax=Paramacrobiotus metropolitanus TaxID=2943436 RepID=UPI002446294C|nr:allatostatin-A receptor-like [Paramacrobiotus metropolitanus]